jgi:hypothetical protein
VVFGEAPAGAQPAKGRKVNLRQPDSAPLETPTQSGAIIRRAAVSRKLKSTYSSAHLHVSRF